MCRQTSGIGSFNATEDPMPKLGCCALALLLFGVPASLSAATVEGIQLHSSISGKGPKTVILVHGWTCDDRTWRSQIPELAKNYRVITLDLPGHGKSGAPKDGKLSMDLVARAIEAVRYEAKADRVVLVGHSRNDRSPGQRLRRRRSTAALRAASMVHYATDACAIGVVRALFRSPIGAGHRSSG